MYVFKELSKVIFLCKIQLLLPTSAAFRLSKIYFFESLNSVEVCDLFNHKLYMWSILKFTVQFSGINFTKQY